jgi:hypothetical protein
MTHDVGQGFIDSARDRAAIRWGEAENLGEAFERAAHHKEQLGIAKQLKFQQKSVIGRETCACCITLTHKKKAIRLSDATRDARFRGEDRRKERKRKWGCICW